MSELIDIYAPGDYIYVRDVGGGIWVYIVQSSGDVRLISGPPVRAE